MSAHPFLSRRFGMASVGLGADKSGDLDRHVHRQRFVETTDCDEDRPKSVRNRSLGETSQVTTEYRTLLLLRHAKSDYPAGVADHDRPLAPRGIREAGLAGDWLRAHAPAVDAVLCSTATRARETLARTRIDAPVDYVEQLYDTTPDTVIEEINSVPSRFDADVETLLVIGHEPVLSQVALDLATAEGSNKTAAENISTKFPTSAIAVLRTAEPWDQLTVSGAALVTFHVPR
jgi:phosphohistidine phosphatase